MADLATLLETEANAEIEAILAEARAKAEATLSAAREHAAALSEARHRTAETDRTATLTRARSAADLETAARRLAANHGVVTGVFTQARQELLALSGTSQYETVLAKLMREAAGALEGVERFEVDPADLNPARAAAAQAGFPSTPVTGAADIKAGVRAVGAGGATSVTNTLLDRLERGREALAPIVARVLAGEA